MIKFFLRFFVILSVCFITLFIYLSFFGIKTKKFDGLIKNKANDINRYIKLDFQETKIYFNPSELNLVVKLQNPKILAKGDEIILSKLDFFLPLRSFVSSDFLLKRAEVAFVKNDIKDLTKITKIFLPKIINKKLKKIFSKGNLEGEFVIPFESDGNLGTDYGFSGKISEALINVTNELQIKNLTTEIKHTKNFGKDIFKMLIINGSAYDLKLKGSEIILERENNETKIESQLWTNGHFDLSKIKRISSLFNLNIVDFKDINGKADLKTSIKFNLDKHYKIKHLSYSTEGNINFLEIHAKENKIIKNYLPNYNSKIIFKDTIFKMINSKSNHILEIDGFLKLNSHFDALKIKEVYNYEKKFFEINGIINLTNSNVEILKLNYIKNEGKKSEVNFNVNFALNKYYNIEKLDFISDKDKIHLSSIKMNKNFEVKDFKNLEIKTFKNGTKNNDFLVNKSKKIIISGEIFDAQPLLKSLYKKTRGKIFSKNFNSEIIINFDKTLTGTNDDISDFAMIASINNGSYNKLNLKGNFSENEIIEMSIYQVDKDKKTLQVISDRARPFVKNFDFVKGFEGGKLEYESTILKEGSISNLLITDFKVSKVPALAQLLTLASLQGIADTLSGEGIRFDSFEMKSNTLGDVLNIEDALAMGPAVSILLSGYVDKGKVVSLRGTLVPATKLNAIIASIPLVGDILVGKKTGEGVIGVSFKMKGPPKNIKTTVNPIKTLTPRFIVRAIEKMKRKKQEESK